MPATAVIVHYGAVGPTLAQVECVRKWTSEIVVVANDGSGDEWYAADPIVSWVVPQRNLGYGGAANLAGRLTDQLVVAILNTDIEIPVEVAEEACQAVSKGDASIVGLRMGNSKGEFLSGAGFVSRFLSLGRMREPTSRFQDCQWVSGAAMFMSRECLGQVRFEEHFFLGMEDLDFCLRAGTMGFKTAVLGSSGVIHEGGRVIGSARWYYYSARNPIWFLRSKRGRLYAVTLAVYFSMLLARVLMADVIKRRGHDRARLMALGIWHGLVLEPLPGDSPFPWEPVKVPSERWGGDV